MSIMGMNKTIALFNRLLDVDVPTVPMIDLPHEKPELPLRRSAAPLPRSTPEREGVPSAKIAAFVRRLAGDDALSMHAVMVLRHGKVIFEGAFGEQDLRAPKYLFSASKSFVSLACGMLIAEGKLSLDEPVEPIFPTKIGLIAKISQRDVTVRDLLTMQSGISFNESECMTTTEWTRELISAAAIGELGRGFFYNSLNTYLLAAIVVKRAGVSLTEYLRTRLFEPLSITDYFWEKSPEGIERGGWGLYLRAEDLAKVGVLVQNGGVFNGKTLIPAAYLADATSAHATPPESFGAFNYGYQIWVGKAGDSFLFNGMLGQNLYGNTKNGILVVTFAGNSDMFQTSSSFTYLFDAFGGGFEDELPANDAEYAALLDLRDRVCPHSGVEYPAASDPRKPKKEQRPSLRARLAARLLPPAVSPLYPDALAPYLGVNFNAKKQNALGLFPLTMQVIQGSYSSGLHTVSLRKSGDTLLLSYTERNACYELPFRFDRACETVLDVMGDKQRVRARGVYFTNTRGRLVVEIRIDFLELPSSRVLRLTFGFGSLTMRQEEVPGAATVSEILRTQADGLSENRSKLISALAEKMDGDLLRYKAADLFDPKIVLAAER